MGNESNKFSNSEEIHTILDALALRLIVECDENLLIEFKENFEKLIEQSIKDNYFWQYCPFDVYKSTFKTRWDKFTDTYIDADIFDFLKDETKNIVGCKEYENDYFGFLYQFEIKGKSTNIQINSLIDEDIAKKIRFSLNRKMEYIEAILDEKTLIPPDSRKIRMILSSEDLPECDRNTEKDSNSETYIDYSESSHSEQFVMLYELGIIDYLKQKINVGLSEKKLAALLSTFTGIDKENLRTMINGTKNRNHNNKVTESSIQLFENKLRQLKIDLTFFKKE